MSIPVIDLSIDDHQKLALLIREACINHGFFYITNHGISLKAQEALEEDTHSFFSLPENEKMKISMKIAGKAWRGYFPLMGELTSGKADLKEGLYFGEEHDESHAKVINHVPLFGKNLFPNFPNTMKDTVFNYINEMKNLGHLLMKIISLSLGLAEDYFYQHFTKDPMILFRIFHYPPTNNDIQAKAPWGVGEHTDYGLLTILKQDQVGGLQIKSNDKWIDAPYIPNTFICNIGDMLEKLTRGYYISTPHRVLNKGGKARFSYPLFFDPNFDSLLKPIDTSSLPQKKATQSKRWDGLNLDDVSGTYGEYILTKIGKVFPDLNN